MLAGATFFKRAGLLAAFLYTGISMASSLILPGASELAGQWTLQKEGSSEFCSIELRATEDVEASGYTLVDDLNCLNRWLPSEPRAWRPIPAGLALLDADGLTLKLFSLQRDGYRTAGHAGEPPLLLRRVVR